MLGLELKKPLKRLAARFFQLSLLPPLVPPPLPRGREQLDGVEGSCPGMLVSPRNSDMFLRRRPGAWPGRNGQAQFPPAPQLHTRASRTQINHAGRSVSASLTQGTTSPESRCPDTGSSSQLLPQATQP